MVGGCGADEDAERFAGAAAVCSGEACLPVVVRCATGVPRSGTAFCCVAGGTVCCAEGPVDDGSGGRRGVVVCCVAWFGDGDGVLGAAGLWSEAVGGVDGVDDVAPRWRDGMVARRVVVDVGAVPRASLDIEKDVGEPAASAGAALGCRSALGLASSDDISRVPCAVRSAVR